MSPPKATYIRCTGIWFNPSSVAGTGKSSVFGLHLKRKNAPSHYGSAQVRYTF